MAKKSRKGKGQKKTYSDNFKYSTNGKSKRQVGIDKKIINAFKQAEMKRSIKTDKDNSYLKITLRISKFLTSRAANVLKDIRRADPLFWRGSDLDAYFEKREQDFLNGNISSDTFKKEMHAIEAFRQACNTTSAFGSKKIRVGNHVERREYYKERGVYSSNREITAFKANLEQVTLIHKELERNYKQLQEKISDGKVKNEKVANIAAENAKNAFEVNKFQSLFGTRITATLNTVASNITIDEMTNSILVKQIKDKNKYSRTVVMRGMSPESLSFIKNLLDGKEGNQKIFDIKKIDGGSMNPSDARKYVNEQTKKAAKECGMYTKDNRFNTHSNRKAFAQNVYDSTAGYTKSRLHRMFKDYLAQQGSNEEQIRKRLTNELRRVNKYRLENGMPKRSFTKEELRNLYTSLLLGHSRMSVVKRNYIVTDKDRQKKGCCKKPRNLAHI